MGPYMIMLYPQMEAPSKLVALINGVINGVAVSSSLVSPRQIHLAKAVGDSLLEHHIPQAYLPLPSQRAEIGWDQGENFHESLINTYCLLLFYVVNMFMSFLTLHSIPSAPDFQIRRLCFECLVERPSFPHAKRGRQRAAKVLLHRSPRRR